MVAQRNELVTKEFNFIPTTFEEALKYATIFANSGLCPEAYRGRPNDILIIWDMGKELGLGRMASLRTLGCFNGMPFAYGDGKLALVKKHPEFEDMKEWYEGNFESGTLTAYCMMKRKNQEPVIRSFSIQDAKTAGLWGKKGTWQQYPKRMLSHRARGFASNDSFPDALYGLPDEHEARDILQSKQVMVVPVPKNKGMEGLKEVLTLMDETIVMDARPSSWSEDEKTDHPKEPIEISKLDELKELIDSRKVTKASITIALKKFGVETIDDLTDEMIDKWSNHLKSKEPK